MARYKLRLLGGFTLLHEDVRELAAPGRKAQALLAYLALNADRVHAREKLATLFWGDRYEDQARHSLRQAVLTLRKTLEDADSEILVSENGGLRLDSQAISVDAPEFERLAAGDGIETLSGAAALYTGELLDGLNVRSEGFDDWVAGERTRFRRYRRRRVGPPGGAPSRGGRCWCRDRDNPAPPRPRPPA
jgi:DNA-binding SARP family transcriptional activator